MKKRTICIPYLVILMLFATMVGCSSRHEERTGEVIEKSTTTTIERPVMEEKKRTTTTTTETQQ